MDQLIQITIDKVHNYVLLNIFIIEFTLQTLITTKQILFIQPHSSLNNKSEHTHYCINLDPFYLSIKIKTQKNTTSTCFPNIHPIYICIVQLDENYSAKIIVSIL